MEQRAYENLQKYYEGSNADTDYKAELRNSREEKYGHIDLCQIKNAFEEFQTIIDGNKGWENEEDMLKDMANFRRERLGL